MSEALQQLQDELATLAPVAALGPLDLLSLPDGVRRLVIWLTRRGDTDSAALAQELKCGEDDASALAAQLVAKGLLHIALTDSAPRYSVNIHARRSARSPSKRLPDLF